VYLDTEAFKKSGHNYRKNVPFAGELRHAVSFWSCFCPWAQSAVSISPHTHHSRTHNPTQTRFVNTQTRTHNPTHALTHNPTHARALRRPPGDTSAEMMAESEGALGGAQGSEKKHPNDFALWKASKRGEPFWASPWGEGRPGWHIECSVVASDILGANMDIHAGGCDLKVQSISGIASSSRCSLLVGQSVNRAIY
jgi:hypothetical protein